MQSNNFIKSLSLKNFLSYGEEGSEVELRPLNIIIGLNTSGKSNFIEALRLLQAVPEKVSKLFEYGSVEDWLWKGNDRLPVAKIETVVEPLAENDIPIRYCFKFTADKHRLKIVDEVVEDSSKRSDNQEDVYFYYRYQQGQPVANIPIVGNNLLRQTRSLQTTNLDATESVLRQRQDNTLYPELTYLGKQFSNIRIYNQWNFELDRPPHTPYPSGGMADEFLNENLTNLVEVLNDLKNTHEDVFDVIEKHLSEFYGWPISLDIKVYATSKELFIKEENFKSRVPAARMSVGTLRYLCLLVILCHPTLPSVICLEEVDIGLHPDQMQKLTDLIIEASEHTQIILTTQSNMFLAGFSEVFRNSPDCANLIVCERDEDGSHLETQDQERLKELLEEDNLAGIWMRGEFYPTGVK